jgi:hypothetical protein
MTVVPFPRRARPAPDQALRLAARRDLHTGVAGSVMVRDWTGEAIDALLTARGLSRDARMTAPLAIAPPPQSYGDAASAGDFAAMLQSAEFSPRGIDIEVDEASLAAGSLAGVERLRARGFGIALAVAPGCPLPLGGRSRGLFTEIVLPAPNRLEPFMGLDDDDPRPLARRLHAARAMGLVVTAVGATDGAWRRALAAAGFDRAEQ